MNSLHPSHMGLVCSFSKDGITLRNSTFSSNRGPWSGLNSFCSPAGYSEVGPQTSLIVYWSNRKLTTEWKEQGYRPSVRMMILLFSRRIHELVPHICNTLIFNSNKTRGYNEGATVVTPLLATRREAGPQSK